MLLLAARLKQRGLHCETFGYFAGGTTFDAIASRLKDRLEDQPDGYLAVGHSLGGLVLRRALAQGARPPAHLFLLGTPNKGSRLARQLKSKAIFRLLAGDSGQLLADPERIESLGALEVPTTVIAGTAGPRVGKRPFGEELHDGIVALSEARIAGAELHALPLLHTFLMNSSKVADLIAAKAAG